MLHNMLIYFIRMCSMEKVKSFTVPTKAFSASLHPNMSCFVVGGEDFKLYKIAYDDGKEMGKSDCFIVRCSECTKCQLMRV